MESKIIRKLTENRNQQLELLLLRMKTTNSNIQCNLHQCIFPPKNYNDKTHSSLKRDECQSPLQVKVKQEQKSRIVNKALKAFSQQSLIRALIIVCHHEKTCSPRKAAGFKFRYGCGGKKTKQEPKPLRCRLNT